MKHLLLASALAMVAVPAAAATFDADEFFAPGSDFEDFVGPSNTNVGTAMAGFSSAVGELSGDCVDNPQFGLDCNSGSGDTQDSFFFTIATGFELIGVTAGTEGGGPADLDIGFFLSDSVSPFGILDFAFFDINSGGTVSNSVYGAGTYSLSVAGGSASETGFFDAAWNVDFEVQAVQAPAVPLPAGLPLLLAGLGVLGLAKTRRKI